MIDKLITLALWPGYIAMSVLGFVVHEALELREELTYHP